MRLAALLFVVACTPTPTQTPTPASVDAGPAEYHASLASTTCAADADCAVTTFSGCCEACPGPIAASSRTELERQQKACAEVECAAHGRVKCDPAEHPDQYRAVCRDKVCQAVELDAVATVTPPSTCTRDEDCAMSTVRSCCSPCGSPPFADSKRNVDALKNRCNAARCARTEPQECKPTEDVSAYHAVCRDSACVAARNPPAVVQQQLTSSERCTKNDECVVSNFAGCCSDCSATAYATSKKALDARNRVCAVVDCAMIPHGPCPAIVDASVYRAVCNGGACGGIKR